MGKNAFTIKQAENFDEIVKHGNTGQRNTLNPHIKRYKDALKCMKKKDCIEVRTITLKKMFPRVANQNETKITKETFQKYKNNLTQKTFALKKKDDTGRISTKKFKIVEQSRGKYFQVVCVEDNIVPEEKVETQEV